MTWASQVGHEFSSGVRSKGSSYARQGRVAIESYGGHNMQAVVQGSGHREYDVEFTWHGRSKLIEAYCSCPHFDGGDFCKHLWATLLVADEQRMSPPASGRLYLKHAHDEDYYDRGDDIWEEDYEDERTHAEVARTSIAVRGKEAKPTPGTPWHQELALLGRRESPTELNELFDPRGRRIWYVVDISASFSSGALAILFYHQQERKDGSWGKVKQLSVSRRDIDSFAQQDADILHLIFGVRLSDSYHNYYYNGALDSITTSYSRADLSPALFQAALPKLCATERFGWVMGDAQPPEDARPLAWDDGPRWQLRIRITANDKRKRWTLGGELIREQTDGTCEHVPLAIPVLLLKSGAVLFEDRIGLLATEGDFRWIQLLRKHETLEVPYADRMQLLSALCESPNLPNFVWPQNLQPEIVTRTPIGHLQVHPSPDYSKVPSWQRPSRPDLYADIHFKYGGQLVPPDCPAQRLLDTETDELIERDAAAEADLLQTLRDLKIVPRTHRHHEQHLPGRLQFAPQRLPAIVADLIGRGWEVEAEGHRIRPAGEFNIRITSGVDWFDVESDIDFGETTASLPALLAAAKSGDGYVLLDDGSRGMLPEAWLERFAPLAELAEIEGDRLRFKTSQAMLLDALLAERADELSIETDRQFATFRDRLQSFAGIAPAKPPRGFRGELRPYQQQGLGWLKFLEAFSLGGCLADDMGLGKTVQVLALLLGRRQRRLGKSERRLPSLVVAPKSVVVNWQLEAERFAPTLEVLNYTGLERKAYRDSLGDYHVVVTTYGTLRRDIEVLRSQPFDYVVLDEAQAIKNDKSHSAKACRLLDARHRLTLTGTPVENHLGELWSQFEFLNPGMLGRSSNFSTLAKSITSYDESEDAASLGTLRRGLAPFILRRTKDEVLTDLPEKNEQTLYCDLLPKDRKQYDDLRNYYRDVLLKRVGKSGMNKSKMHVLEALLRLRQAACHPGLIDKKLVGRPSAKLDALIEQLTEVSSEGHKALVFSQFTSLLAIVRNRLDAQQVVYEYLDGRTRKRQDRIDRFQTDANCTAFLISLKAGGTGLNLTAADYVFLLDPWWNPAVESQAIDRAHRIGQTRRVFAYRLIARDTVEEKVLELQQRKRKLADAIVSGNGAMLGNLTVEDLQLLLS